jgi:hypothetical protein
MEQMTKTDTFDIMQSDMKLWEKAEKFPAKGGGVSVTLNLPFGIGEHTVTMEGMNDAQGKRNAVGAYGEYIRGLIKERIDDEAVTSRAKAAAAKAEPIDSGDSLLVSTEGVPIPPTQEEVDANSSEAYERNATRPVGLRETLIARRTEIDNERDYYYRRFNEAIDEIKRLDRDRKAVNLALESLGEEDAPEVQGEAGEDTSRESDDQVPVVQNDVDTGRDDDRTNEGEEG